MLFDILFVALLATFVLIGLYQGVIKQIFSLVALLAIWFYFRFFSFGAAAFVASHSKLSEASAYITALVVGIIIIYLVFALVGLLVAHLTRSKDEAPVQSHNPARMFLGFLRGLLIAGFLFCLIDMLPARIINTMPAVRSGVEQSYVLKAVSFINPLSDFRFLANSALYAEILKDEKAQKALQEQKAVIELTNLNDVRDLINDKEVQQLIRERKILQLLSNPKVERVLDDPEVRRRLNEMDPETALYVARHPSN